MKNVDERWKCAFALLSAAVILCVGSQILENAGGQRREEERIAVFQKLLSGKGEIHTEQIHGEENVKAAWSHPEGYVVETGVPGYVDEIVLWTAVDPDGHVTGLTVRRMNETYGLGGRALRDRMFLRQFLGTQGFAEVGTNVDALTGATVTSKAIAKAVNAASVYVTGADGLTEPTEWGDEDES